MATERISSFQLIMLLVLFIGAPFVGVAIGHFSPHESHLQANRLLNQIFQLDNETASRAGATTQDGEYLTVTDASGNVVCADGMQHEVPCWRMQMERGLLSDISGPYTPSAPEQLYGILKERAGPDGTFTTLGKKHDLLEQPTKIKRTSGSRLDSAKKALSK